MVKQFVQNDFKLVCARLEGMGVGQDLSTQNLNKLRKIHSVVYSFALWADRISDLFCAENEIVFLVDLKSDLIQTLPLVLSGYKKATAILLRSSIENILKHIYFFDHPVEFARCKNSGFFLKMDELCDYLKNHPVVGDKMQRMKVLNVLTSRYSELSEIIHGKRALKRDITQSLKDIEFEQRFYDECHRIITLFGNVYNFMLACFHANTLDEWDTPTRESVLSNLNKKAYGVFAKG